MKTGVRSLLVAAIMAGGFLVSLASQPSSAQGIPYMGVSPTGMPMRHHHHHHHHCMGNMMGTNGMGYMNGSGYANPYGMSGYPAMNTGYGMPMNYGGNGMNAYGNYGYNTPYANGNYGNGYGRLMNSGFGRVIGRIL